MSFTIEEIYGCNRGEYCIITGVSPSELIKHLDLEVFVLKQNLRNTQIKYRNGGAFTDEEQRKRADLIRHITKKIESKTAKIKDIKKNMEVDYERD